MVRSPSNGSPRRWSAPVGTMLAAVLSTGLLVTIAERPLPAAESGPANVTAALLKPLKAREIGPAIMSGRVSDLAFDPADPYTFYIGLGTGGIMKTGDGGATFRAIFEKEPVAAIGAVAVSPADPKVLWAGTGEANDRNSSSWGDGVYRSTDGGETWTNTGLHDSRTIARIVPHPTDPGTAWVAAVGDLWTWSSGRGLFKTTDGGKTWRPVLSAATPSVGAGATGASGRVEKRSAAGGGTAAYADRLGCGDVLIDPTNPNVLYAALYARRRTPWSFDAGPDATDGKDLGGIFKSVDGGESWEKLGGGLPAKTGRIGLAIHAKNTKILYALVQSLEGGISGSSWDPRSKTGGVFRTEDAGATWTRVSDLDPRPFYFSQIRVDPVNDQRVYLLGVMLHISEDGGRTFREDYFQKVHPDCHAMAIDPRDPRRVLLGTDGGAYLTHDGGKGWEHLNRFAAGEFYRISLDDSDPYRICGGLQDNLNWVGPSRTYSKEGIVNRDWINIGGGDGFCCVFDPDDPDIVYAESQQGGVHRFDMSNGDSRQLRPQAAEGQPAFRFHWASPLKGSLHTRGVMYLAGNRVFKLTGRGERWETISPDLSSRDPDRTTAAGSGAESYGVVYTLSESPVQAGLLWAGMDEGRLWLTRDEGGSWTDLTGSLPRAVKGQWISRVEAGWHDPKVAYLAVDAHRSGDLAPHVYRTSDQGATWSDISSDLPAEGPVKVIREDPVNPDLLYAGTEFGLFVSLDRGARWIPLGGLPTVAVDDLAIQRRQADLVIATHGRSLYVLDDIRPLQGLRPDVRAKGVFLFEPGPAFGTNILEGFADWNGNGVYRGVNPPEGALLTVWVGEFTGEKIKLTVSDVNGVPVANLELPGTPGLNRVNWDLRPTSDLLEEYGGIGRRFVRPGDYTVKMTRGETEQEVTLHVDIAEGIETR